MLELESMCVIQITSGAVLDSILTLDAVLQQPTIFMLIVTVYGCPSLLNFTFTFLQNESVFKDQDDFSFAKDRFSISKNFCYFVLVGLQSLQCEVQEHHSEFKRGYLMKGVLCMLMQYCCIKV